MSARETSVESAIQLLNTMLHNVVAAPNHNAYEQVQASDVKPHSAPGSRSSSIERSGSQLQSRLDSQLQEDGGGRHRAASTCISLRRPPTERDADPDDSHSVDIKDDGMEERMVNITYNLTLLEERFKVLAVTSEGRDAKTVDDVNVPKSLEAFVDPDLMRLTLGFLDHFQDEARVRVVHIYQWLFKVPTCQIRAITMLLGEDDNCILQSIVDGCDKKQTWSECGALLRVFLKHPAVAKRVLSNQLLLEPILGSLLSRRTDMSASAFELLKLVFRRHLDETVEFFEQHHVRVRQVMESGLKSRNYATKLQTVQLFSFVLSQRDYFDFMILVLDDTAILRRTLDCFVGRVLDSFHIAKMYFIYPRKSPQVAALLAERREALLDALAKTELTSARHQKELARSVAAIESMGG